jgi:hypothetical protein
MSTGYDPSFNPYQPPSQAAQPMQGQWAHTHGPNSVSPAIIESLRKTRPWVMLIAVLGAIGVGFMVLGGLVMLATLGAPAVVYLVMAGIYALPLISMFKFSSAIERLLHGGGQPELEQAVDAQRSFWQTMGIFTLVGIAFGILGAIGMAMFVSSFKGF